MRLLLTMAIISISCSISWSQEGLPIDDVEVIREYEANLQLSKAILTSPDLIEVSSPAIDNQYDIDIGEVDLDYPPPYIRPIGMRPEKNPSIYHGYIQALYGTLNNPVLHGEYDVYKKDYFNLGAAVHYEAFSDQDVLNKKYRKASGEVRGTYFLTEQTKINALVSYERESVFFYGLQDSAFTSIQDSPLDSQNIQRDISHVQLTSSITQNINQSLIAEGGFQYGLNSSNDSGIDENHIEAYGKIKYYTLKSLTAQVQAGIDYTFLNQDIDDRQFKHVYIEPSISFSKSKYSLHLSTRLLNDTEQSYFLPNVSIKTNLSKEISLLLSGKSYITKHSLENLLTVNPFYNQSFTSSTNAVHQDISLTIDYHKVKQLSIKAQVGYQIFKDHYFFLNDFGDYTFNNIEVLTANKPLEFSKITDDATDIYFRTELRYPVSNMINFRGQIEKHFINVDNIEKAWHVSSLNASLGADASLLQDRLMIGSSIHIQDGVPFIGLVDSGKTGIQYDLSVDIKARVIDRVMLNFQAMNLLNSEYERWNGYANFGLHLNGGIIVKL